MTWCAQWRNRVNHRLAKAADSTAPEPAQDAPTTPEPIAEHDPMQDLDGIARVAKAIKPLTGHILIYWFSKWDTYSDYSCRTGVAIAVGPDVEHVGVGDVVMGAHYIVLAGSLAGNADAEFIPCNASGGGYPQLLLMDAGQFVAKIKGQVPQEFTQRIRRLVGGDMGRLEA